MWSLFAAFVFVALLVDFFVMTKQGTHEVGIREAAIWSLTWVAVSFAFLGGLYLYLNTTERPSVAQDQALAFLTGYVIEKALAIDNIFVFLVLFKYFRVPAELQKRVLMIGVLGALALRAVMILIGAWLIAKFDFILYGFGAFLVFTGVKMWRAAGEEPDLESSSALRFLRRRLKLAPEHDGESFTTTIDGVVHVTPLFVVAILIGVIDVVFAVDSIPAIFAITTDPFIVLSSNVFAILGLRAMYFLLAGVQERFHLLSHGLSVVLCFIGTKMLLIDVYHVPIGWSLGVTAGVLAASMLLSLKIPARRPSSTAYPFDARQRDASAGAD
jgi:tellurite resistance protein TerC